MNPPIEPEYRRRARIKAAQDEERARLERHEAQRHAGEVDIAARIIERIESNQASTEQAEAARHKKQHRLHWGEVIGLFVAAGVGIAAIYYASKDSHQQWEVMNAQLGAMKGQLEEAKNQRLTTIAQLRGTLRRESPTVHLMTEENELARAGQKVARIQFQPAWANAGATPIREITHWFVIKSFENKEKRVLTHGDCPANPPSEIGRAPLSLAQGTIFHEIAKGLPVEEVQGAKAEQRFILMWGRITYRDVFPDTPDHFHEWCVAVVPNDPMRSLFSFISLKENAE